MNVVHKPTPALAWVFNKQPRAQWPDWIEKVRVSTTMGLQGIGPSAVGTLIVPVRQGQSETAAPGDVLVWTGFTVGEDGVRAGGEVRVLKPAVFAALYEEVEAAPPAA